MSDNQRGALIEAERREPSGESYSHFTFASHPGESEASHESTAQLIDRIFVEEFFAGIQQPAVSS